MSLHRNPLTDLQSIIELLFGFCGINGEDYWNVTWMLYDADATSHMIFTLTISWLLKQQWICAHNTLLTLIASKQASWQTSKFVRTNVTYSSYHLNTISIAFPVLSFTHRLRLETIHVIIIYILNICDIHFARKTVDAGESPAETFVFTIYKYIENRGIYTNQL